MKKSDFISHFSVVMRPLLWGNLNFFLDIHIPTTDGYAQGKQLNLKYVCFVFGNSFYLS